MVRMTKKVFTDLALLMIGFGLFIGIIFPFFMLALGISPHIALSWWFFLACMVAGVIVGFVNIALAKSVVGSRLALLAKHMVTIESHLKEIAGKNEPFICNPKECHLPVDSADSIGESAHAFNMLVDTLSQAMQTEIGIRTYTQMLTTYLETDTLCSHALRTLLEVSKASSGVIFIEEGGETVLKAHKGIKDPHLLKENQIIRGVLRDEQRLIIDIPEGVLLDGALTSYRPRQVICEPIRYKQIPIGIIVLACKETFKAEDISSLDLFSKSLALALHNAMTHDQVQRLAAIDPLTGVYNRRFGMTRLREEYVRSVQTESAIGLMMFDIDHFKQVNDAYGHSFGDRVLRQIVLIARNILREGDLIVRLGGDEFLIILVGASSFDVQQNGEKLRRQVAEAIISTGGQNVGITISIGGVSFPEYEASGETELIEATDKALYVAKEMGRNRVSMA